MGYGMAPELIQVNVRRRRIAKVWSRRML